MPAPNPLFDTYERTDEQEMMEELIIESISIYGINMFYLPKDTQSLDYLYGEDVSTTRYPTAKQIEMYMKDNESFEGQGAFLEQFGMQFEQQSVFTVAIRRFEDTFPNMQRPQEGDLLWFPLNKTMFEIQYVEHESIFYQLGKLYTYDLECELFQFSNEIFETGIKEIDDFGIRIAHGRDVELDVTNSVGDFKVGEWIYQGDSFEDALVVGRVKEWRPEENTVQLINLSATPVNGEFIIGYDSGARWKSNIGDKQRFNMDSSATSDNQDIEDEAAQYIGFDDKEFDERSPYGDF